MVRYFISRLMLGEFETRVAARDGYPVMRKWKWKWK
jgi:hypothetical protein